MINLIPGMQTTADALNVERVRMDIISQNIANAHTTKDANGDVYQRKQVAFEAYLQDSNGVDHPQRGVRVAAIENDPRPGQVVYQPGHPHADAEGMVTLPNVELSREMVDMITSSRAYEANLSVVKTARQMAMQALSIGK